MTTQGTVLVPRTLLQLALEWEEADARYDELTSAREVAAKKKENAMIALEAAFSGVSGRSSFRAPEIAPLIRKLAEEMKR